MNRIREYSEIIFIYNIIISYGGTGIFLFQYEVVKKQGLGRPSVKCQGDCSISFLYSEFKGMLFPAAVGAFQLRINIVGQNIHYMFESFARSGCKLPYISLSSFKLKG